MWSDFDYLNLIFQPFKNKITQILVEYRKTVMKNRTTLSKTVHFLIKNVFPRVIRKKHLQYVIYLSVHLVTYFVSYNRKASL